MLSRTTSQSPSSRTLSRVFSVLAALILASPRASAQLRLTDDSYTQQNAPNANNGNDGTVSVQGSATTARRTYLRFNISSLPAGINSSNLSGANLVLFASTVNSSGTF